MAPLNRFGDSPLYYRIAAHLRDQIEAGEIEAHAPVPSERALSADFGVSRMTARQAIATLEREGYVYRQPSRGTFVAEPRIQLAIGSFSDEVLRRGGRPGARVLHADQEEPTGLIQSALGIAAGRRVNYVQRLRLFDDEPIAIENSYLPAELCPGLLDMDLTGSIWDLLRREFEICAARSTARIEAIALDPFEAEQLGVRENEAAILLTRRTYDHGGRCFELARDVYRGDRAEFAVEADLSERSSFESLLGFDGDPVGR